MTNPTLSIVILNYNTKDLVLDCLKSLVKVRDETDFEMIVVDNGSTDGSVAAIRKSEFSFENLTIVENRQNLGFAGGNNAARPYCHGRYILFLNSDTLVKPGVLRETLAYLAENPAVGVITCKQIMLNGKIDPDSRRSFPTPWVAFTHFSYLDRIFPHSRLFAQYWYGYKSADEVHEIDVSQGAFLMTPGKVLDEVGWFSEEYFLDGEDIDLSWKIKAKGYKIVYYPKVAIIHLKKASKKKAGKMPVGMGVDSMLIFYRKFMWSRYPGYLNWLVVAGIKLVKLVRILKVI